MVLAPDFFFFLTTGSSGDGTEPADVSTSQDAHTHTEVHSFTGACVCVCREEEAVCMYCCQITEI